MKIKQKRIELGIEHLVLNQLSTFMYRIRRNQLSKEGLVELKEILDRFYQINIKN